MPSNTLAADLRELMQAHEVFDEHGVVDEQKHKKCMKCLKPKRKVSSSHPYQVFQRLIKDDLHARLPMQGGNSKDVFGQRSKLTSKAYAAYKKADGQYTDEVKRIIKES